MNLAFLLHLYQPPTQTDSSFKAITSECYSPLFKLIKSKSNSHFTLNTPLSLLEQFDRQGHTDLINTLKDLAANDRVEFTGSAAYHALLPRVSTNMAEKQIMLNEYALGYYYGQRSGFEGENAVMMKNIRGFFPPEMAVNADIMKTLDDLGYEWVAVDDDALEDRAISSIDFKSPAFYTFDGLNIKLAVRDTNLSDMISFKRDGDASDVFNQLLSMKEKGIECVFIALDGEVFGHHNRDGIFFLESLIDDLEKADIKLVTVSEMLQYCPIKEAAGVVESTWSSVSGQKTEEIYPFWDDPKNLIQQNLWKMFALVEPSFLKLSPPPIDDGYENLAIWKTAELQKIHNQELKDYLSLELLVYKALHSDQFWWASGKTVYDKVLYSPVMVKNALELYKELSANPLISAIEPKISSYAEKISKQLSS